VVHQLAEFGAVAVYIGGEDQDHGGYYLFI
jgi:hypothetical protein